MIFGAILAGGTGTRIKQHKIPKQFIKLCNKPIIIHTIEKMLSINMFDYIYVAIHPNYKKLLQNILQEFNLNNKVIIISGGNERINTIQNVINSITNEHNNDDDVVVIHDAVRPFVSKEILYNSIITAQEHGICVATIPSIDTMYILDNDGYIQYFPERKSLFHGQAPDSFKVKIIKEALETLTDEELKKITGTIQICANKGYQIKSIAGDYKNIKITTDNDLLLAENILKEEMKNESLCVNR